jgi:hypothetical protein
VNLKLKPRHGKREMYYDLSSAPYLCPLTQNTNPETAELGELRLEIAKRQEIDGMVAHRLQNGHRAMQDALREQQLAINSALDVIPAFDNMHASVIKALAEGGPANASCFDYPVLCMPLHSSRSKKDDDDNNNDNNNNNNKNKNAKLK